jgi:hypothetical protein
VLFSLAAVPAAVSQVLKEQAFRALPRHCPLVLSLAGALCAAALFLPVLLLSVAAVSSQSPLAALHSLKAATACVLPHADPAAHPSACLGAGAHVLRFLGLSGLYNVTVALVIAAGSAALVTTSAAVAVPLSSLALGLPLVAGPAAAPLRPTDLAALAVIVGGVCVFRMHPAVPPRNSPRDKAK